LTDPTDMDLQSAGRTVVLGSGEQAAHAQAACLVVIRGVRLGSRLQPGDDPVVIGRDVEADFQLADRSVSRRHCRIFREDDRFWVEDLGSTNHTFVNEHQIDRCSLHDGDLVRISHTVLKFIDEGNIEADYHSELHETSIRDPLTGLYNRRHAMAVLDNETARAGHGKDYKVSLVILDIDFFKKINDEHGHLAGDSVLQQIGRIVCERMRSTDTVARIGGEEFAVILPETTREQARRLADEVRSRIAETAFVCDDKQLDVTLSAGVAEWEADMQSVSDLLRAADERLYQAKRSGRNRVSH